MISADGYFSAWMISGSFGQSCFSTTFICYFFYLPSLFDWPCNACVKASCLQDAKESAQRPTSHVLCVRLDGSVLVIVHPAGVLPFLLEWVLRLVLGSALGLGGWAVEAPLESANRICHSHHMMRSELPRCFPSWQKDWLIVVVGWQPRNWLVVWPPVGQ
ncbi:hypothetical protein V6N12_069245 [Hibiscus sabdariffa]|uniref:Uncharacterized protein n=1 Tax=Hibiscus sabdariffa TaxID=183260 RepID=A0ABR2FDN6_9ROSI